MAEVEISELEPRTFFRKETGLIASVKPDFKPRKGQRAFSELVLAVSEEPGKHILGEMPTGFGKSFAALVPAIIKAVQQRKRIVISTETIALQDQYTLHDLPLLQKACEANGIRFTFAVAKGRANYICKAKLDEDLEGEQTQVFDGLKRWGMLQQVGQHSGDRGTVPFSITDKDWKTVGADEDCERKGCPFFGKGRKGHSDCFIFDAQRKFAEADIIVTNHTLFLLDAQNASVGTFLGPYDMAIVDEAHTLPEQAQSAWGMQVHPRTVSATMRLCHKMLRRAQINHFEAGFLEYYMEMEDKMFAPFKPHLKHSTYLKNLPDRVVDESKGAAITLIQNLVSENKMLKDFAEDNPSTQEMVAQARDKIYKIIRALKGIYGEDIDDDFKDNWIVYLETNIRRDGVKYGVLNCKPIEVAPLIKGNLLDLVPNVVFMSATLKINDSFQFMRRELGMSVENCVEFTGETPFDYYEAVQSYFPDDLPDPMADDYEERLAKRIRTIIRRRKGRCLVLFTSADLMKKIYFRLENVVPYHCFCQGDFSKNLLIEKFKADEGSCLFATRSFFVGVDVPGNALSTVILTKSPFRVPSDPVFKARCDKMKDRGQDDFRGLSMPLMLMDIRQAFGRLIRSVNDTGMFCFLDSRANKKPYGRDIRRALPRTRMVDEVPEL